MRLAVSARCFSPWKGTSSNSPTWPPSMISPLRSISARCVDDSGGGTAIGLPLPHGLKVRDDNYSFLSGLGVPAHDLSETLLGLGVQSPVDLKGIADGLGHGVVVTLLRDLFQALQAPLVEREHDAALVRHTVPPFSFLSMYHTTYSL